MKCPICGEELKPSKKDQRYMLCHNCRKKFKIPETTDPKTGQTDQLSGKSPVRTPEQTAAALDDELTEQTQVFSREDVRAALRKANEERKAEKAASKAASRKISSSASNVEPASDDDEEFHLRYANLPPKSVREKQEREMRRAYDELLSIGKEERSTKKHGLFGKRN